MKGFIAFLAVAVVAASAVILEPKPFKRQIPADRLRDFRTKCFASTQCRVFDINESWSLEPFCGKATCRLAENKKGDKFLIEEVLDCGPAVDLEQSPGCQLVSTAEELKDKQYPDCCPVYDCPEGADVVYVNPNPKKDEAAN